MSSKEGDEMHGNASRLMAISKMHYSPSSVFINDDG